MPADQRPAGDSMHDARHRRTSRRVLLLAGLAVPVMPALVGCTLRIGQPDVEPALPPSADELALARAAADADVLAAGAREAAALRPDVAAVLLVIARQHVDHVRALRPASAPGATSATASATPAPPLTPASAVPAQRSAEQAAVSAVEADLPKASGEVARLLASVAACRAVHVAQLAALTATAR